MIIKCASWTEIKTLYQARDLGLQYYTATSQYYLYCTDGIVVWTYGLVRDSGTDVTDFETNHKSMANSNIRQQFQPTGFQHFDQDLFHKSFDYDTEANDTAEYSEAFSEDVYIYGGEYIVEGDVNDGDYLEIMITDEDNILGYGAGTVLNKFIETEYISAEQRFRSISSTDGSLVPEGFYLTAKYVAVGSSAPRFIVRYYLRK